MSTNRQWYAAFGIVGGLIAALLVGLALSPELEVIGVGSRAPSFRAVDLATGDTVGIEQYRGDVLLLNIWATWCGPCEAEMPSMEHLHQELGPEGLKVVAVSIDIGDGDNVREWVEERGLTFEILHDPTGRIERIYQTTGVPESFIIDRTGVIVKKEIGARAWDHPAQKTLMRQLLGADQAGAERRGS